jgi:hypothetical protein
MASETDLLYLVLLVLLTLIVHLVLSIRALRPPPKKDSVLGQVHRGTGSSLDPPNKSRRAL